MPKIATSRAKAGEFRIQSPWFRDFLRSNIFVPKRVRQTMRPDAFKVSHWVCLHAISLAENFI